MPDYANKQTRELIVSLAACVGLADTLAATDFRNKKQANRSIKAFKNHAEKALAAMMDGLSDESVQSVLRYAKVSELLVLPKSDPRTQKEYYVVPVDVMDRLLEDINSECAICFKHGDEVRGCARRKDLVQAGIIDRAGRECPFAKGG